MALDYFLMYSVAQAITVSARSNNPAIGPTISGVTYPGVIDFVGGSTNIFYGSTPDPAQGPHKMLLKVAVVTTFAGPANATLMFDLDESADAINWVHSPIGSNYAIPLTQLVAGQFLFWGNLPFQGSGAIAGTTTPALPIVPPPGGVTPLARYTSVYYTVANGPFTAGAIQAWLEPL
jgi:hypothetical protein